VARGEVEPAVLDSLRQLMGAATDV